MIKKETIIIGAGLAGLSAAYHLKKNYLVMESGSRPGGECITDKVKGYHFDKAGHLLHLRDKSIKRLIDKLMPDQFNLIERDARIHIRDKECRYPFQANLYHLSPEYKGKALLDYLKAATEDNKKAIKDFDGWCRASFGDTITELFLKPYNEKLWTVPLSELTLDWMGKFVPRPDVKRVVAGAFADIKDGGGYNAAFYYPKKGGINQLADALANNSDHINLNSSVTEIDIKNKKLTINNQEKYQWQQLVSSMPLPSLVACLKNPPQAILNAMKKLFWNSVLVINLGVKRKAVHQAHWLYFPEKKYSFYRVGFPGNFGHVAPKNNSALYVEVALEAGTGWADRTKIAKQARKDLIKAGLLKTADEITVEHLQYIPYAYVIHDKDYLKARQVLLDYFGKNNIYCIGRFGNWNYSAMEDALIAGKDVAKRIKKKK